MFENIKSLYFLRILFKHLNEPTKLRIVKYNKNIQNIIQINIIDYKRFSGRFIIYETKKRGKEYNGYTEKLIYEGEYLNGERDGIGEEYNENGNIMFKGEYRNGKRHGKGKELNLYKELIFEGDYYNGLKWNGKGYDPKKNIIYELIEGKGFIKEYNYDAQLIYEGEYLNGKRHGKGKEYDYLNSRKDKYLVFEGSYFNGFRWNGIRYDSGKNIIYELKDGKGKVEENDINWIFQGEYLNGDKNGKGKEYFNWFWCRLIFEGEYINGKRNGKGRE